MRKLAQEAQTLFEVNLTHQQTSALAVYERELQKWNQVHNLTAIRDEDGMRVKHFLDSISCVQALRSFPVARLIDVGTGAGFPGLPLKILFPAVQLTLVESVRKKTEFCRHLVQELKLDNVQVIHARAEEVGQMKEHREQYDVAVARAVAIIPVLAEYLLPLVKIGGMMLAQKGESGPAEVQTAEQALKVMGGKFQKLIPVTLPGVVEDRYLVVVDKIAATPSIYPRKPGIPSKKPI